MPVTMQGSWTVRVKAKSAAFQQRFKIAGASVGNGTHPGTTGSASIFVSGASWSVTIESNDGTGWKPSKERYKFPTTNLTHVFVDIESDDTANDGDFNDLVLECSSPKTESDFVVYGSVRCYSGFCILNPCFPFVVIDTHLQLIEALKNPELYKAIKLLYPERVRPRPNPPDPAPFTPLVIPIDGPAGLPERQFLLMSLGEDVSLGAEGKKKSKGEVAEAEETVRTVKSVRLVSALRSTSARFSDVIDRRGLSAIVGRIRLACQTESLPGVVIRFLEYDRTSTELGGGAYTGTGARETLGVATTDVNGNYVFRFTRGVADVVDEVLNDVGPTENATVQAAPDLLAQLLDPMAAGGVAFETALYANVPLLKRINLCIPKGKCRVETACQGSNAIQAVGDIFIGAPTLGPVLGQPAGFGPRVGFNNVVSQDGRVTARNSSGPTTECAAWHSRLDFYACFLDKPAVKTYTIRHRVLGTTTWQFYSEVLKHPLVAKVGLPGYDGEIIGPASTGLNVDGGGVINVPAYENIESDIAYVFTHRTRKAQFTSSLYATPPTAVQFWIEGYDNGGNKVAGAEDSITLFIDNSTPNLDIDENVTMGSASAGNCALFTLPSGDTHTPLTVRFLADQAQGFLQSYTLGMQKGATGTFGIVEQSPAPPPFRTRSYVHGDDFACTNFRGTFDDPTHELLSGFVSVTLVPTDPSGWLTASQTFCAFSITLNATTRRTNGYTGYDSTPATPVLIGIQK